MHHLSLAEVRQGLDDVARLAQPTFGSFDARPLNWQPDGSRWSIAQCFEHLVIANRVMMGAAMDALDDARSRTIWQRLPVLPGILGRTLIRSQAPETARKFKASPKAQPAARVVAADIVQQFGQRHRDAVDWLRALDDVRRAAGHDLGAAQDRRDLMAPQWLRTRPTGDSSSSVRSRG